MESPADHGGKRRSPCAVGGSALRGASAFLDLRDLLRDKLRFRILRSRAGGCDSPRRRARKFTRGERPDAANLASREDRESGGGRGVGNALRRKRLLCGGRGELRFFRGPADVDPLRDFENEMRDRAELFLPRIERRDSEAIRNSIFVVRSLVDGRRNVRGRMLFGARGDLRSRRVACGNGRVRRDGIADGARNARGGGDGWRNRAAT